MSGCVERAVLENDVRNAIGKSRALDTESDVALAFAALSSQLVELEALYQRDPNDSRVRALLSRDFSLMARGFVELRYLDALSIDDRARADYEAGLRADAEARARFYGKGLGPDALRLRLDQELAPARTACEHHDHSRYEAELHRLLRASPDAAGARLESALLAALSARLLDPRLAQRCEF
jgi:hypothetical protein